MNQQCCYQLSALPLKLVFGGLAEILTDELSSKYQVEAGLQPKHWVLRIYHNGAVIPAPTQLDDKVLPEARLRRLFQQALQKVGQLGMHYLNEADKFGLMNASNQIEELCKLRAA